MTAILDRIRTVRNKLDNFENIDQAQDYISNLSSDDYFDTYDAPTIAIGRIPSVNPLLVDQFINKLTNFILNPTIGEWRDKAILIADDEYKNGENQACEIKHTTNSDIIYDLLAPFMNVDIMYGVEYDAIMTSDGLSHKDLNQDIMNEVNNGIALLNYIGHGDQRTLSAEKIIDKLQNLGVTVQIYDPFFASDEIFGIKVVKNIENIISKVDAAIIVTAHDEFKTLKPSLFSQTSNSILIDTRGVIDPTEAKQEKLIFRGLGRGD